MAKDRYTYGNHVTLEQACPALLKILDQMEPVVREGLNKGVRQAAQQGAVITKLSGGYTNRRPKYRGSISFRSSTAGPVVEAQIYAKGHEYSLTHLLENGHHLWNAPGRRTCAFKHWKVGEDWVDANLARLILQNIEF